MSSGWVMTSARGSALFWGGVIAALWRLASFPYERPGDRDTRTAQSQAKSTTRVRVQRAGAVIQSQSIKIVNIHLTILELILTKLKPIQYAMDSLHMMAGALRRPTYAANFRR